MTQPEGVGHPILRGIGKFFAVIFIVKFVILFPVYMILVGTNNTLLNRSFLESRLTDGVAYDASMSIVKSVLLTQASGEEGIDVQDGESLPFDEDILDSIPNLLPEDHYNSLVSDALDGIFPYIQGTTDELSITLDLSVIQAQFPAHLRAVLEDSDPCAPGVDFEGVISSEGLCRPADLDAFFNSPEVKDQLSSFMNDQFSSSYVIDSSTLEKEPREMLENARMVYGYVQTAIYVGGAGLAILLLLSALLMSRFAHRKIITGGVVLLIPSIILLVSARLANFLVSQDGFELPVEEMTDAAKQGQVIAVHLASGLFLQLTYISIVVIFLGAILIIGGEASKHWLMSRSQKSPK